MSAAAWLVAAFDEGVRDTIPPLRGDENFLHVTDLTWCARDVVCRLRGHRRIEPSAMTRYSWQRGLWAEDFMWRALRVPVDDQAYRIERGALVWLQATNDELKAGRLEPIAYSAGELVDVKENRAFALDPACTFIGHPDFVVRSEAGETILVECKTEKRKNNPAPYELQAAAYALALGADRCVLAILRDADRGEAAVADFYDIDHLRLANTLRAKMEFLIGFVHAAALPPSIPPQKWMCRYCGNAKPIKEDDETTGCRLNENPDGNIVA